jgi:starch synthase
MKIAFVVSEVEDIIKTGGLADVAKALPVALKGLGHDVCIIMPGYQKVLAKLESLHNIPISTMGDSSFKLFEVALQGIPVYLVDHPYFDRPELYAENNVAYSDNGQRFAFFSHTVTDVLQAVNFIPDIIHCNDWHTALTPFFIRQHTTAAQMASLPAVFANTKTVLTIHNAAFQGIFSVNDIAELAPYHHALLLDHHGDVNMLKVGIHYADKITAVSPTYATELLTDLGSHGLHFALQNRSTDLAGIINGCDYTQWDPTTDPLLPKNYSVADMSGKADCKQALQSQFGLPTVSSIPVFGMVCRLTQQKGFGYILPILGQLMQHNIQVVIVGTGEPFVCQQLSDFAKVHPDKFAFLEGFEPELAHLIEAGSDFFLMPSEFEPCGLNQMYSLAYGTLPIVRKVGGLKDTVTGIDDDPTCATGFSFAEPEPQALLTCLRRAILLYLEHPKMYREMQERAMHTKFTWENSARDFVRLYQQT